MSDAFEDWSPDEQAAWWLLRHRERRADEVAWQTWLSRDPSHRVIYEQLAATWRALDTLPMAQIRSDWRPSSRPGGKARRAWWHRPLAAGVAMAFTVGGVSWGVHAYLTQPVYEHHFSTARAQFMRVRLPDGSELWLDAASGVDVRFFRSHRDVVLRNGQVQFKVRSDAARPFHVQAAQTRVTVVGTEFTVRHLSDEVEVAVLSGLVRVDSLNPQAGWSHLLRAEQVVRADALGVHSELSEQPVALMGAWRQGRIVFNNTPLDRALAEFSRYVVSSSWRLADPSLGNMRITGSFELDRADSFLRTLPFVLPVKVVSHGLYRDIAKR